MQQNFSGTRINRSLSQSGKRLSHVRPKRPILDLNGPGRLRTSHILAIFSVSHSTLYERLKLGTFPKPDGKDGKMNYWNTSTIRNHLQATDK